MDEHRRISMSLPDKSPDPGLEPRIGRSVSLDHAAELLGVSRRTIYNRIREGRLQTIRTLGGSQRVLLESVQEMRGDRDRSGVGSGSAASPSTNSAPAAPRARQTAGTTVALLFALLATPVFAQRHAR